MATNDNSHSLLSKVAKFVRNPTKDWSELDKPVAAPEGDDGKQALKRMIQRKRHDDAVRKYEFAQLRKLRRDSSSGKIETMQFGTEFRSSSGDVDDDERETTLKKIDDIEAQMSQQWWKGRTPPPAVAEPRGANGAASPVTAPTAPAASGAAFAATVPAKEFDPIDDVPTEMSVSLESAYQATSPHSENLKRMGSGFSTPLRKSYSNSKMGAIDMGPILSDPELEEAAIRYANGDNAGAETALLAALQLPDARLEVLEGWMAALFDLYRSTGQQASFERMALEYAHRFGRSGPIWEALDSIAATLPTALVHPTTGGLKTPTSIRWDCPAELDDVTMDRLGCFVDSTATNYLLDWSEIQGMTPTALKSFSKWVAQWCEQPLTFTFLGADALMNLLHQLSPSGDKGVPEYLWLLRLNLMRVMRLQDDYEITALDFCVTFEVSPPPWRDPVCHHVFKPHAGAHDPSHFEHTILQGDVSAGLDAEQAESPFALQGELLGDVASVVRQWQQLPPPEGVWVIGCAHLSRVDFSAAGSLLNWVAKAQADGAAIEFQDVPRLVAAFFNLIGINEYARVLPRAL